MRQPLRSGFYDGGKETMTVSIKTGLKQRYDKLRLQLKREIHERKKAERKTVVSERHYGRLLGQSRNMQEHLRHLSRQILQAQEEERKEISRELHDEIAQTLSAISLHLGSLKTEASVNTKGLRKKISRTQRIVARSVNIVHRFARNLRPTLLDDLGVIPALESFIRGFTKRTRIPVRFKSHPDVERLNSARRTALYRVAQASLTNVAQHAHASLVKIEMQRVNGSLHMQIRDDGKSFQVERVLYARKNKRLGLLGMRERIEMVGGRFSVASVKGTGTTIGAEVPLP